MFKVGLTGGIGCGKSTISALFETLNVPVIDADVIAHKIVGIGQPALKMLTQAFGNEIINSDESLNRTKLREQIFEKLDKKKQLESILHPLIYAEIETKLLALDTAYCIISIPLLIETAKMDFVDRILVVDCPVEMQIMRIKQRDQLSEARIHSILASQVSRAKRLSIADDVIENTTTEGQLKHVVETLHNLYFSLSTT